MKRITVFFVCISIVCSLCPSISAEHWSDKLFSEWEKSGYFEGDINKDINVDSEITRGEFIFLADKIRPIDEELAYNEFADLDSNMWYAGAVLKAVNAKIIQGYGDGTIRCESHITREEAVTIVARAFDITGMGKNLFNDDAEISYWAKYHVNFMGENKFINGYEDGNFRPNENMTRAEAVTLLNNAMRSFSFDYSFDDDEIDGEPVDWYVSNPENATVLSDTLKGNVLKIAKNDSNESFLAEKHFEKPLTGIVNIEFDIKTDELGGSKWIYLTDSVARSDVTVCIGVGIENNVLRAFNTMGNKDIMTVKYGKWYRVRIAADLDNNVYDLYVDGNAKSYNLAMRAPLNNVGKMSLNIPSGATGTLYFGNLSLYNGRKPLPETQIKEVSESYTVDFSGEVLNEAPSTRGWDVLDPVKASKVLEDSGERYLAIEKDAVDKDTDVVLTKTFDDAYGGFVEVNFDVKVGEIPSSEKPIIFARHRIYLSIKGNSLYTVNTGGNYTSVFSGISSNKWYGIKLLVNTAAAQYDVYVDGKKVATGVKFRNSTPYVDNMIIAVSKSAYGSIYFRNITLTKLLEAPVEKPEPVKGYTLGTDAPDLSAWTEKFQPEPTGIVYEAENMVLNNYDVENRERLHNGEGAFVKSEGRGTASFRFEGESGYYGIRTGYYESEGAFDSVYRLYHNGKQIDFWYGQFDDLYRHVRNNKNYYYIENGDTFLLEGYFGKDPSGIDYVEFCDARKTEAEGKAILVEDIFHTHTGTPRSSWDTGGSGGKAKILWTSNKTYDIYDSSNSENVWAKRTFLRQEAGTLTAQFKFFVESDICDGIEFDLRDGTKEAIKLLIKNENLYVDGKDGDLQLIYENIKPGQFVWITIKSDISSKNAEIYSFGDEDKGLQITLPDNINGLDNFYVCTPNEGMTHVGLGYLRIFKGYSINDAFLEQSRETSPTGWTYDSKNGNALVSGMWAYTAYDQNSLKLTKQSGDSFKINRSIKTEDKIVNYEFDMLLPQKADKFEASLKNKGEYISSFVADGTDFVYKNKDGGKTVVWQNYKNNIFYNIKLSFNTEEQTCDVYVNKRKMAEKLPVLSSQNTVDCVEACVLGNGERVAWIDTIEVYGGEYICNVPEPKPAVMKDDYIVGVQACDLWTEGIHIGWDSVRPYDNRTPLLGYYEDCSPEVADWQIKWLTEHGINLYLTCWYRPTKGIIRESENVYALEDGFMGAKYFDKIKFAIMYENGGGVASAEDFKENVLPFWIERYFKNPQYQLIDNKPLITVWRPDKMAEEVGGVEACAKLFDEVDEMLKKEGFDGAVWMTVDQSSDAKRRNTLKSMGYDYTYAYSYAGVSMEEQLRTMDNIRKAGIVDFIPTVCQGYGHEPWGQHMRKTNNTLNEWRYGFKWLKENYMNKVAPDSLASKMVFLGNWNEIAEGHTLVPSYLSGFGYLDEVREAFTEGGEHEDIVPDTVYDIKYPRLWQED